MKKKTHKTDYSLEEQKQLKTKNQWYALKNFLDAVLCTETNGFDSNDEV